MTIKESRQLVLPLQTVLDAVVHFDRRENGSLARGDVVDAAFVSGNPRDEGLDVAVLSSDRVIEWRHFDTDDISRAIIAFFRSQRIPLPYSGNKSLSITSQGAAFSIENTVNIKSRAQIDADLAGRPLRYARGYEPHALQPSTQTESFV